MVEQQPVTELSSFSSPGAVATPWTQGRADLSDAQLYWLSTVRPDGRPHVTPLIGIWLAGAMYLCTGATERKAKNLVLNPRCILTTGSNRIDEGLDLVVEGAAAKVSTLAELERVADTYESKYGSQFTAPEGTWFGLGDAIRAGTAVVYRVTPAIIFGFGKGQQFSQTRWTFTASSSDQVLERTRHGSALE